MLRRIQAVSLVVALLAVPLALVARAYACAPQECTMMCCPAHKHAGHGMKMNCHSGVTAASMCTMRCNSPKTMDYGLASPLPPTQLQAALPLPVLEAAQNFFSTDYLHAMSGFSRVPFEPPRL